LRTQPILSEGMPCSMRESATNGVQLGRPLKSRMRDQTASAGASRTLEV
jgi:hypothetical protein